MSRSQQTRSLCRPPRRQRGAALIVMLVIVVLGAAAFFVSSFSNSGLQIARDQKTAEVLAQAKEALIGKSLIYDDYPGSLPCPDTDDDGISDSLAPTNCPSYIGRLPWKTLGLPDLRDATGERLWYTLSRNVRRYPSVIPLNSDTTGTLNITGTYVASNLIAIIFSPGANTGNQSRSASQMTACATTGDTRKESLCAANYLEGSNANPSPGSSPNVNYQSSDANIEFNDQLITITHDQLFSKVEKRVAGELRKHLNEYYASWGAYPFAANFSDPSGALYRGSTSNYQGLYPFGSLIGIGFPPPNPRWSSSPITISFSNGSTPSFDCEPKDYDGNTDARVRCTSSASYVTLPAGVTVNMTAKLKDVGRGFWKPFSLDVKNIGTFDSNDEQVRVRDKDGNYDFATNIFDSVSVTGMLNYTDGSATVVFSAKGKSGGSKFERIDMRGIQYESATLPTWIHDNKWYELVYYATSPGYASGNSACNPLPGTPSCLTVNGQGGGNDKRAVIIMTGKKLSVQSRPPAPVAISDYLEGENSSPLDYIFENQTHSTSFNDQVVIVAP